MFSKLPVADSCDPTLKQACFKTGTSRDLVLAAHFVVFLPLYNNMTTRKVVHSCNLIAQIFLTVRLCESFCEITTLNLICLETLHKNF